MDFKLIPVFHLSFCLYFCNLLNLGYQWSYQSLVRMFQRLNNNLKIKYNLLGVQYYTSVLVLLENVLKDLTASKKCLTKKRSKHYYLMLYLMTIAESSIANAILLRSHITNLFKRPGVKLNQNIGSSLEERIVPRHLNLKERGVRILLNSNICQFRNKNIKLLTHAFLVLSFQL